MRDITDLNYDRLKVHDSRFDPSTDTPIYIGGHEDTNADDNDPNWVIKKLTYSGTAITRLQKTKGKWSDRATLF